MKSEQGRNDERERERSGGNTVEVHRESRRSVTREGGREGERERGWLKEGNKLKNGFSLTAGPHYVQLHLFPF